MGEYDAISAARRFALISDQIADLERQVEELRQQAERGRQDIKTLKENLEALAARLPAAADHGRRETPAAARWDTLDKEEYARQLAGLRDWVNGILRIQYPEYTDPEAEGTEYRLPGCWEQHPAALWELGNLHAEWQRVYDSPDVAALGHALLFHDRWLPQTLRRLSRAITPDKNLGCRVPGHIGLSSGL